jgi:hypothetical protein
LWTYDGIRQQPLVCLEIQQRTFEQKALIAVDAIAVRPGVTDLVAQHTEPFLLAANRVYRAKSAGIYCDLVFRNHRAAVQQLEGRASARRHPHINSPIGSRPAQLHYRTSVDNLKVQAVDAPHVSLREIR